MGKILKKILIYLVSIFCILTSVTLHASYVYAENSDKSKWQSCTVYNGDNIDDQNYYTWASTIKSYLTETSDGNLMRVQALSDGRVLVEYYTNDYQLINSKIIDERLLSIFGGFYETSSNYYIVSGQLNRQEDNDLEVFRINKYDKNWNYIDSASLSNCNTTVPFRAGTARMDDYEDYLFIRTSHEMYASSDGLNHQSNYTIVVKMSDMTVSDAYSQFESMSYVSHSFNQFIKVTEDGVIASVDHGDGFPRCIVLNEHPYSYTEVYKFEGELGQNTTGASVGGFEISDSNYLIAGNSVIQDESFISRTTRNIYVWVVNQNNKEITTKQITNYDEGDGTTSTPHLVKINNNQFMLLWTRNDTIYYVQIDSNGNMISDIYQLCGGLSDCSPVVIENKIVWYTWDENIINFYEINLSDLSTASTKEIINGHEFELNGVINSAEGTVENECIHCGLIEYLTYIQSMSVYWNDTGYGSYYSYVIDEVDVGANSYCLIDFSPRDNDDKFEIIIDDPTVLSWTASNAYNYSGYFTGLKAGSTKVVIRSKLNSSLSKTYNFTVYGPLEILSFTAEKKENKVNLFVEATGGKSDLNYRFYQLNSDGEKEIIYEGDNSNCLWIPQVAGVNTLYVDVYDGTNTVTKSLDYIVSDEDIKQLLGDINQDKTINYNDAVMILQADSKLIELTELQKLAADVNGDDIIDYNDAVQILKYDAGLIKEFI